MDDPRGALLDPAWYLAANADVAQAGADPLDHYLRFGVIEGRSPNAYFDPFWYAWRYPDVDATAADPALHYMRQGAAEARDPHPEFSAAWYAGRADAANPLVHWLTEGRDRGLSPTPPPAFAYGGSGGAPAPCPPDLKVDVVIPVRDGAAPLARCLASVLDDADRPPGDIVIVDDASRDPAVIARLDALAAEGCIRLIRAERSRGFVESANAGMAAGDDDGRDVALLNSDTRVPRGWLARLAGHAHAGRRVGSVSPFSNNAAICSYPCPIGPAMPFDRPLAAVDAACLAANAGRRVDLPTTVGSCMYIRRDCLRDTGVFDAAAFGRGYGEENDFCQRASARGWRHMLACDVFVYHQGGASFGAEALALYRENNDLLARRYPHYRRIVAAHARQDPAAHARFAATARLLRGAGGAVLSMGRLSHGGPDVVRLDLTRDGASMELSLPFHAAHPRARMPADATDDAAAILDDFGVTAIHRSDWRPLPPSFGAVAARLGLPIELGPPGYRRLRITLARATPRGVRETAEISSMKSEPIRGTIQAPSLE